MDLISSYNDDSDDPGVAPPSKVPAFSGLMRTVDAAPAVDDIREAQKFTDPKGQVMYYNPRFEELQAPLQGPVHPLETVSRTIKVGLGSKDVPTGRVEEAAMNDVAFNEQFHTFHSFGYAADPTGSGDFVGNSGRRAILKGQTVYDKGHGSAALGGKRAREESSRDVTSDQWKGPWAAYQFESKPEMTPELKAIIERTRRAHLEKQAIKEAKQTAAAQGRDIREAIEEAKERVAAELAAEAATRMTEEETEAGMFLLYFHFVGC